MTSCPARPHRSPRFTARAPLGALAGALVALVLPSIGAAQTLLPDAPHVDKPLYAPTLDGFEHFLQDELGELVKDHRWWWRGRSFQSVRLHDIRKTWVTRSRGAGRDDAAPLTGWAIAMIHVQVDGRLLSGRIEVNASYVWQPGGWAWDEVLLYLGIGDSYDFVSGEVL